MQDAPADRRKPPSGVVESRRPGDGSESVSAGSSAWIRRLILARRGLAWSPYLAWGVAAATLVTVIATATAGSAFAIDAVLLGLGFLGFSAVGAVAAGRAVRNPVGWLLLATGLIWNVAQYCDVYVRVYAAPVPAAVLNLVWVPALGLPALAVLVFPDGHPPNRAGRWWAIGLTGVIVALSVTSGLAEGEVYGVANPWSVLPGAVTDPVEAVLTPLLFAGVTGCLVFVFIRYRRSTGIERLQLRLLRLAAVVVLLGFLASDLLALAGVPDSATSTINVLVLLTLAAAMVAALLRYRLWGVDLLVDRAVAYGALLGALGAVYVAVLVGLGALTGRSGPRGVVLGTLATAIAAVAFQPLREWTRRRAHALVFGRSTAVIGSDGAADRPSAPPPADTPMRRTTGPAHPPARPPLPPVVPFTSATEHPIIVRTLGGFLVIRGTEPLGTAHWRSRRARTLLKILIAKRGRPVTREILTDVLWPGEPPGPLPARLSVQISTLRAVLDPAKAHPGGWFVGADQSTVWVDLAHLRVDVEDFLAAAQRGLAGDGSALREAEAAYLGDFLEGDLYEDWSRDLREQARAEYIAVLRAIAGTARAERDADTAVRYLLRVLELDPYDSSAHSTLVATLESAGRHGEARRAHRRYAARMAEIGVASEPYPNRS